VGWLEVTQQQEPSLQPRYNLVLFLNDPDNKSARQDVDRDECSFQQISRHKPQDQDHHLGTFLQAA